MSLHPRNTLPPKTLIFLHENHLQAQGFSPESLTQIALNLLAVKKTSTENIYKTICVLKMGCCH